MRDFFGNALILVLVLAVLEFLGFPALSFLAWAVGGVRDLVGYSVSLVPSLQGAVS